MTRFLLTLMLNDLFSKGTGYLQKSVSDPWLFPSLSEGSVVTFELVKTLQAAARDFQPLSLSRNRPRVTWAGAGRAVPVQGDTG